MRIALIGYGKMGREIEAIAREQGDTIAVVFDSKRPVSAQDLADVDVCIEFSSPPLRWRTFARLLKPEKILLSVRRAGSSILPS